MHNDPTGSLVTRWPCTWSMAVRRRCFIITKCLTLLALCMSVCGLVGTEAPAAAAPADPGASAADALTLQFGAPYDGAIDRLGDVDVFAIPPTVVLSVVRVQVKHTNAVCEIWAGSIDRTGAEVNHVFVTPDGVSLATVSVAGDTIYVGVSAGPFLPCLGATYSIQTSIQPVLPGKAAQGPTVPTAASGGGPVSLADVLTCQAYCNAAAKTATRIRLIRQKLASAPANGRSRLRRRLRRARGAYRHYHHLELKHCALAQL
jgi:hypothetical protein